MDKAISKSLDEELKKRKEMIGGYPKVIQERIKSMGLMPGEIEIKIRQINGLYVDVNRKMF